MLLEMELKLPSYPPPPPTQVQQRLDLLTNTSPVLMWLSFADVYPEPHPDQHVILLSFHPDATRGRNCIANEESYSTSAQRAAKQQWRVLLTRTFIVSGVSAARMSRTHIRLERMNKTLYYFFCYISYLL